ncbi:GDSL-like Lipase/Acylhydrolase [Caulifigura coniformis]|uniref:GDSL-like Lipase/Acylhydrolase n=1 Tax=Caulifigura coniformis TaxID=2527983 RepID=A0A517SA29_9PLAN|nr:SGNH/GDSL hydrolase family protein [Caulifigura coniformis]QDT52987.1 GDSL-like Lipase/Acylhydrolase [Caulifigura coniformis]
MKPVARIAFALLALGLFARPAWSFQAPAVEAAKPELKPLLGKLELQDGDSIVFLGDSITHQVLYTQYVEDYFYTRFPKMRLKFHNAGVGGDRAWDALARFDRDVAAYKPKYVTVLLGMNDGSVKAYDDALFKTYQQDMTELLKRITDIGATPILITPTMFDSRADRARPKNTRAPEDTALYNATLAYYGTWLREVAQENGWGFVDMWGPLNAITTEQRKTNPSFTMIKDAVHPLEDGQLIMAAAIINDIAPSRRVSAISITRGPKGQFRAGKPAGGVLSDLVADPEKVEFTWTADSLPWVVPANAALGVKLSKMGHRLGAESLQIAGLEPGRYTLTIDDVEVGSYTAEALSRRVELQGNEKTPQYQQALEVAMLNAKRNKGPFEGEIDGPERMKRNWWRKFQTYARTKRQSDATPADEALKKKVEELAKQIENLDEQVSKYNAQSKAIEDEIFQKNQPKPRKYVLKKVAGPANAKGSRKNA